MRLYCLFQLIMKALRLNQKGIENSEVTVGGILFDLFVYYLFHSYNGKMPLDVSRLYKL